MSGYFGNQLSGEPPLNYDEYLKVPQLLSLQQCKSNPAHHDEMLFIIIHQTYELWFRLILHECDSAIVAMDEEDLVRADRQLNRVIEIMRILVPQIHILETMIPSEFLGFRDHLKPASGFQSAQFRELEIITGLKERRILHAFRDEPEAQARLERRLASRTLSDSFYQLLNRHGFQIGEQPPRDQNDAYLAWREAAIKELLNLYHEPAKHYQLFRLAEELISIDEYLSLWRFHHVKMVERMVGFKMGTGGSEGVGYLQKTLEMKSFPELWQVRTHMELKS